MNTHSNVNIKHNSVELYQTVHPLSHYVSTIINIVVFLIFLIASTSAVYSQDYSKMMVLQTKLKALMQKMVVNQNNPDKYKQLFKEFEKLSKQMNAESQKFTQEVNTYKASLHPVIQELHNLSNKACLELEPVTQAEEINKISKEILEKVMKIYSGETEVTFPGSSFVIQIRFCTETVATIIDKGTAVSTDNLYNFKYNLKIPIKASWSTLYSLDIVNKKGYFFGYTLYSEKQTESANKIEVSGLNGYKQIIKINGNKFKGPVDRHKVDLGGSIFIGPSKMKQFNIFDISQYPTNIVKKYSLNYIMPVIWYSSSAGDQLEELLGIPSPCYKTVNDGVFLSEKEISDALEKGIFKKTLVQATTDPGCIDNKVTIEIPFPVLGCDAKKTAKKGAIALAGGCIDHGGFILATDDTFIVNGKPVARVGDKVFCFIHGVTEIITNDPNNVTSDTRKIARTGDKTKCGARIISGSSDTFAGNK